VYGAQALGSSDVQQIHGHLVSQAVTTGCTSPVGLCTAGRLEGVINGDFVFTASSLQPSATPGVFFYTGEIVVTTNQGEVRCQDAGAYSFVDPSGPVVDLCTITGGTGKYAGVSGHLRIHSTFTFAQGGDSHYEGTMTH
jgi:hypothetical protein